MITLTTTTDRLWEQARMQCARQSWVRRTWASGVPVVRRYSASPTRIYTYDINEHGQLFLSDTKMKNFTSCYKDKAFLDFFYQRLRRNAPDDEYEEGLRHREQGYRWVSPCGPELNYVRSTSSPIVYQDLSPDGSLLYAGTLTTPFDPASLRADPRTGYLYHPSPPPPRGRPAKDRYGAYSLLRSSLVLARLRDGMEVDDDGSGRFVWRGETRTFGLLESRDVE